MTQQEFEELSEKFSQSQCTPEELIRLEEWLDAVSGELREHLIFVNEEEAVETRTRMWLLLKNEMGVANRPRGFYRSMIKVTLGLVACALLIIFSQLLHSKTDNSNESNTLVGIESKNGGKKGQLILLPDSSTVLLEADASIIIDEKFGVVNRSVQLKGGAYFDIRKNARQPFLVYSDGLVTEVLGTSFYIKPEEKNRKIEVSVVTGKVSVYTKGAGSDMKRDGVIVSPNHKIVYDTELKTLRHDLVDFPKIITKEDQPADFNFNESRIENVLSLMQASYGIEIVVVNPVLNKSSVTGNLNGIDMYQQLDFICEVLNARYELRGSTIFIMGNEGK